MERLWKDPLKGEGFKSHFFMTLQSTLSENPISGPKCAIFERRNMRVQKIPANLV